MKRGGSGEHWGDVHRDGRATSDTPSRGFLTHQDPKQFLFFIRTPGGIRAGQEFLARLNERSQNRDKAITVTALQAQLKALRRWGSKKPALAQRLPNRDLIIYPDAGHGGVFQFHADSVPKGLEFLAR